MSSVVDEVITRFRADNKDFLSKSKEVLSKSKELEKQLEQLEQGRGRGKGNSFKAFTDSFSSLTDNLTKAFPAVGGPLGNLATKMEGLAGLATTPAGIAVGISAITVAAVAATSATGFLVGALSSMQGIALAGYGAMKGNLFLAITEPMRMAAAEIDTIQRSFTSMLQSPQKGKQMMSFIQSYGLKSPFEQSGLVDAAKTLTMVGKDVNRFLPVLETLALFQGPQTENLVDVSSIIRRLAGGQIADAMGPEGLGRFGISKALLTNYGAKFNKAGSFEGGIDDAFRVLERLTQEDPRFSGLKGLSEGSDMVRYSNAADAMALAFQKAGAVINSAFGPAIEGATNFIKYLAESGLIENLASKWSKLFGGEGSSSADLFTRALAAIYVGLDSLPGVLGQVEGAFLNVVNTLIGGLNVFLSSLSQIRDDINGVTNAVPNAFKALGRLLPTDPILKFIFGPGKAQPGLAPFSPIAELTSRSFDLGKKLGTDFTGKVDKILGGWNDSSKQTKPAVLAPDTTFSLNTGNELQKEANDKLGQIAKNTDTLGSLKDMLLGGRGSGELNLTPVELAGLGAKGTRSIAESIEVLVGTIVYKELERFNNAGGYSR